MKTALLFGLALCASAALAHAEALRPAPVASAAPIVRVDADDYYWRRQHDHDEWRRREEFREREAQREEWQHDHCVRDWTGHVWCR